MSVKFASANIFKDLGFDESESVEIKFKADLYVILKKTLAKQKLTGRQLEQIWDVSQPRVSEVITGKLDKVSIGRLLHFLSALGVTVHPAEQRKKSA